jgi:hypothetical protein
MQNTSGGIQHILLRLILLERVSTEKTSDYLCGWLYDLWYKESTLDFVVSLVERKGNNPHIPLNKGGEGVVNSSS